MDGSSLGHVHIKMAVTEPNVLLFSVVRTPHREGQVYLDRPTLLDGNRASQSEIKNKIKRQHFGTSQESTSRC